ncbi:hypothetical protein ACM44_10450 [Chryseobacterium koreense CCUG 49689]|uniref:Uncharacterized protein n=2 Tax=Chryseobacterium koreense TaxID=232216 RepID=A0A0J7IXL9_9FLAO|nr:hypothetical protein ACM44_10450 [Chryseobacterium koreense CCUG 49689]
MIFSMLVSCTKDNEAISEKTITDSSALSKTDSLQNPSLETPDSAALFLINPQDISAGKARSVFSKDGLTLFYFDQNTNSGNIRIDGNDYALTSYDFNENNYTLSGKEVKIEASNGDFNDQSGDCMEGTFPDVKVTLKDKTINLSNIKLKDCPDY